MSDVPVTFVNSIVQAGFSNGIYNVAFSTARYTPVANSDGKLVAAANEFVSANLRMDLFCAQQLHASLAKIIEQQTKAAPSKSEVN